MNVREKSSQRKRWWIQNLISLRKPRFPFCSAFTFSAFCSFLKIHQRNNWKFRHEPFYHPTPGWDRFTTHVNSYRILIAFVVRWNIFEVIRWIIYWEECNRRKALGEKCSLPNRAAAPEVAGRLTGFRKFRFSLRLQVLRGKGRERESSPKAWLKDESTSTEAIIPTATLPKKSLHLHRAYTNWVLMYVFSLLINP